MRSGVADSIKECFEESEKQGEVFEVSTDEDVTTITPHADKTYRRGYRKIGRNEPCPCGSERKYKKCCLNGNTENRTIPPRRVGRGVRPRQGIRDEGYDSNRTLGDGHTH